MKSNHRCNGKHAIKIALLAVFGFVSLHGESAWALDYQGSVFGGVSWTDNADNENDDLVDLKTNFAQEVGASIDLSHRARHYYASIDYSGVYEQNSYNAFSDDTILEGSAFVNLLIVPEVLHFTIATSSDSTVRNTQLEDTPENRDQETSVYYGPSLAMELSNRDVIVASVRHINTEFSERQSADRERYRSEMSWERAVNRKTSMVLSARYIDTEFDNNPEDDFVFKQVSYSINRRTAFGSVGFLVAENETLGERENAFSVYGEVRRVGVWSFELSKSTEDTASGDLGETGGVQASEASSGGSVDDSSPVQGGDAGTNTDSNDLVTAKSISLTWDLPLRSRYRSSISYIWEDDQYKRGTIPDEVRQELSLDFELTVTTRLTTSFELGFENVEFDDINQREDDTVRLGFGTSYRLNPDTSITGSVDYETQDSNVEVNEYDSWSSEVRLTYDF
ncbi:MAG: outer membrane beta-barrel protein [Pseudomonadales bacterium]|nr:outer membrane beta-barrel protein [Pseudomonadales bacterium]